MFNINIYDSDDLERLQEKETFLKLYQTGIKKDDIMEQMDITGHKYSILVDEYVTLEVKEIRDRKMEFNKIAGAKVI